jgi:hypothetical protein
MVSMIFRRDVLEHFLRWMKPLWKEAPIDWTLEDFTTITKARARIYQMVKHIGIQSLFKFNQQRPIMTPAEKREYIKNNKAKILPEVPGQCQDMDTEHILVFGMPTMARQDNPDYLKWTVESMRQNCIKLHMVRSSLVSH